MMNVNDKAPLLSVIIPCWNGAEYIAEMLDSIISQSFNDWRCFLVDDRSTDNTVEIIQQYCKKDARFNLLVRDCEPKGAQTCRNLGFAQSEGSKYIIYLDCDDIIAPYCFEQRVNYIEKHQDLDFAIFPAKMFHENITDDTGEYLGIKWCENDLEGFWTGYLPFVVITNIYKRDSIEKKHLSWDNKIKSLQDRAFNMQALIKDLKYEYATDVKVDYYWRVVQNSNSITTKIKTKGHLDSHLYLLDKLFFLMSEEHKRGCARAINLQLLKFAEIFLSNNSNDLFNTLWIKNNKFIQIRMLLYAKMNFSKYAMYVLFPFTAFYKRRIVGQYLACKKDFDKRQHCS